MVYINEAAFVTTFFNNFCIFNLHIGQVCQKCTTNQCIYAVPPATLSTLKWAYKNLKLKMFRAY